MDSRRGRMVLGIVMSTLLLACGRAPGDRANRAEAAADARTRSVAAKSPMAPVTADAVVEESGKTTAPAPSMMGGRIGESTDSARRFVVTAEARFQVKDVYATVTTIEDAVAAEQGFIVENKIDTQTGRERERVIGEGRKLQLTEVTTSGELVVRVPVARTGTFLRGLAQHMAFLDGRDISARDVQFDLLRKQLEARRQQTLAHSLDRMGGEPGRIADKVGAANSGSEAQAGSDEAEVAQRELEDSIAFSTVRLSLYQPPLLRSLEVPDVDAQMRARSPGFFAQMGEAFRVGWRLVLEGLLALTAVWPLGVVLAAIVWAARRWRRGRGVMPRGTSSTQQSS